MWSSKPVFEDSLSSIHFVQQWQETANRGRVHQEWIDSEWVDSTRVERAEHSNDTARVHTHPRCKFTRSLPCLGITCSVEKLVSQSTPLKDDELFVSSDENAEFDRTNKLKPKLVEHFLDYIDNRIVFRVIFERYTLPTLDSGQQRTLWRWQLKQMLMDNQNDKSSSSSVFCCCPSWMCFPLCKQQQNWVHAFQMMPLHSWQGDGLNLKQFYQLLYNVHFDVFNPAHRRQNKMGRNGPITNFYIATEAVQPMWVLRWVQSTSINVDPLPDGCSNEMPTNPF